MDIAVSAGVPVYAAADGVVTHAGYDHGYGWMVEIRHRAGFITRYAHLSKVWLSAGDSVSIGEHLGNIGRSHRISSAFRGAKRRQAMKPNGAIQDSIP